MTSLLTGPDRSAGASAAAPPRRPLVPIALLGGLAAAVAPLTICLALGVVGWFVSDAGAHGEPHDGLRLGAAAWLLAHGSGARVAGAAVTVVPLGLSLLCAWVVWRAGLRVGDAVSGRGPDADALADGERDWTVPATTVLFGVGYAAAALVAARLAEVPGASAPRLLAWSAGLTLLVVLPAVAVGSGRAAIWAAALPVSARAAARVAARVVLLHLAVSGLLLAAALAADFATGASLLSRLRFDAGEAGLLTLATATVTPNAVAFAGCYLLGPGFAVGTGTLVSPTLVSLGPVPAFPLLTALPDTAPAPAWTTGLLALPVVVATLAAAWPSSRPELRWDRGLLRGCVGGVLAGVVLAAVAGLAGGAVGPGRMREVGPAAVDVLVHGVAAFGLGGLLGAALLTWWSRRTADRAT